MDNKQVYSVSQVNNYIHTKFDADARLRYISIKGELSNVKYHGAGHIYFTLKDAQSSLSAVMFKSDAASLSFELKEGRAVIASGSVGTFVRDGKYQLYVHSIKKEGEGELFEQYEKLLRQLNSASNRVLIAELNMGLDSITLREDLNPIDVLKQLVL